MDRAIRLVGFFGIAAVAVYITTTAAGSVLDPSYSQLRQHVSDLTATGASTWQALAPAYVVYNALCLAFAIALYMASTRGRLFKVGLGTLVINAFAGLMMVSLFREDLPSAPSTLSGSGHIIFASVSSLSIVVGSIVYGFAFRNSPMWRRLSVFSFAIGATMFAFAPVAVIAINSPMAGLTERFAIGVFVVWLLGVAGFALNRVSWRRSIIGRQHVEL